MKLNAAQHKYVWTLMGCMGAYAGILFGVISLFNNNSLSGPLAYFAGVLPAVPIIGVFIAIGRYLTQEKDEYLRMLLVRQSLIATGLALSAATAWGFLEVFRLVPHVDAYWIAVLWFAGLGVGSVANKLWP